MTESNSAAAFQPPGARSVLLSVVVAFFVAATLLITVVLPAEYGIDPTGLGETLGLTVMSELQSATPTPPAAPLVRVIEEPELLPQPPEVIPGLPVPAPLKDPAVVQRPGTPPRIDSIDVALVLGEEVEMKAVLDAQQAIIYSWSVTGGEVYYDFHAEPSSGPEGYFVRYAEGEGSADSGSLVSPFAGHHGWYWLNISEHPVTVHLQVTGYHKELVEVYRGRQGL